MKRLIVLLAMLWSLPVLAGSFDSDVIVLGEVHDNPHHHARQAEIVMQVQPAALVFEMLTAKQAQAYTSDADAAALAKAFGWAEAGWPDFSMYYPIFAAAPSARVFGAAVPRDQARKAMTNGLVETFGDAAMSYGLANTLPAAEQAAREDFQRAVHCDALPEEMLPGMVNVQRLRDAELARTALGAFTETGGPVVVITGNGHARTDWGMLVYLRNAAPDLTLVALGQGEDDVPPDGVFDQVEFAPRAERADPCDAFR